MLRKNTPNSRRNTSGARLEPVWNRVWFFGLVTGGASRNRSGPIPSDSTSLRNTEHLLSENTPQFPSEHVRNPSGTRVEPIAFFGLVSGGSRRIPSGSRLEPLAFSPWLRWKATSRRNQFSGGSRLNPSGSRPEPMAFFAMPTDASPPNAQISHRHPVFYYNTIKEGGVTRPASLTLASGLLL